MILARRLSQFVVWFGALIILVNLILLFKPVNLNGS